MTNMTNLCQHNAYIKRGKYMHMGIQMVPLFGYLLQQWDMDQTKKHFITCSIVIGKPNTLGVQNILTIQCLLNLTQSIKISSKLHIFLPPHNKGTFYIPNSYLRWIFIMVWILQLSSSLEN